jgi:hypothetical protein
MALARIRPRRDIDESAVGLDRAIVQFAHDASSPRRQQTAYPQAIGGIGIIQIGHEECSAPAATHERLATAEPFKVGISVETEPGWNYPAFPTAQCHGRSTRRPQLGNSFAAFEQRSSNILVV